MKSISQLVNEFTKNGATQSAHTDELMDRKTLKSNGDLFYVSINFYNETILKIKELNIPLVHAELYIELLTNNRKITRSPRNLPALIKQIDNFAMPEIYISKPKKDFWQPRIEMYVSPLPFTFDLADPEVDVYYQEYRTLYDQQADFKYTRWLKFSYIKNG